LQTIISTIITINNTQIAATIPPIMAPDEDELDATTTVYLGYATITA
jgi:hypothetical protein